MKKLKTHVFICTNTRENGKESCGAKGSENLRKKVKEEAKMLYGENIRINASGCLGPCEEGIVCAIYPQNEWMVNLVAQDHDKIMEEIKKMMNS